MDSYRYVRKQKITRTRYSRNSRVRGKGLEPLRKGGFISPLSSATRTPVLSPRACKSSKHDRPKAATKNTTESFPRIKTLFLKNQSLIVSHYLENNLTFRSFSGPKRPKATYWFPLQKPLILSYRIKKYQDHLSFDRKNQRILQYSLKIPFCCSCGNSLSNHHTNCTKSGFN